MMSNMRRIASTAAFLLLSIFVHTALSPAQTQSRGAEYNRSGMQHYSEAFYRELPQGRRQEAERLFDIAALEFQSAIAADPNDAEAQRNLARLYYVRKKYSQAAQLYRNLTILEPQNIDTYLQLAVCYTRLHQFDSAIQELEIAKTKTDTREVIEKLDNYIRRITEGGQD
jgi:tetratricopeptide (TPR) repeat protein